MVAGKLLSLEEMLLGTQTIEILQGMFASQYSWVFFAITLLGDENVLVGLSAVIYWCFDKRCGRLVTYTLLFGAYLNLFLKVLIPWPRPPVDLRMVEKNDAAYGFPSGHAQDAATFWASVSLYFRKRGLVFFGTVIVLAVGMSRIYLGVHYPLQVVGGWMIGLAVAWIGITITRHPPARSKAIPVNPQVLMAIAIVLPLVVAFGLLGTSEANWGRVGGYLFGFWVGTLAEAQYVRFTTEVSRARKILRIVVGGTIACLLSLGLSRIFPVGYLVPGFVISAVQGLFIALIVPAFFNMIEGKRSNF